MPTLSTLYEFNRPAGKIQIVVGVYDANPEEHWAAGFIVNYDVQGHVSKTAYLPRKEPAPTVRAAVTGMVDRAVALLNRDSDGERFSVFDFRPIRSDGTSKRN